MRRKIKEWSGKTKHSICYFSKFTHSLSSIAFSSSSLNMTTTERSTWKNRSFWLESWILKSKKKQQEDDRKFNNIFYPTEKSTLTFFYRTPPMSRGWEKSLSTPAIILFMSVSKKYFLTFIFSAKKKLSFVAAERMMTEMTESGGLNWWDEQQRAAVNSIFQVDSRSSVDVRTILIRQITRRNISTVISKTCHFLGALRVDKWQRQLFINIVVVLSPLSFSDSVECSRSGRLRRRGNSLQLWQMHGDIY